jgi:hypothetical protein
MKPKFSQLEQLAIDYFEHEVRIELITLRDQQSDSESYKLLNKAIDTLLEQKRRFAVDK